MRHHAWLTVPPRPADRAAEGRAVKARDETLPEASPHREYPPVGVYDALIGWLAEAGWCRWGEGGAHELSWLELEAWARMTRTPLSPWEAQALHVLSIHYAVMANASREPACLPVWPEHEDIGPEERQRRREAVRSALRGGLANRQTANGAAQ